jgi:hypothetical protein
MSTSDIVTRMLEINGFGWQCGEPLKDKGSYFRCSCGCSQPDKDWDGSMTIKQPMILRDATDEIIRLRAERDEARRSLCRVESACRTCTVEEWVRNELDGLTKWIPVDPRVVAEERGWDCFKEADK